MPSKKDEFKNYYIVYSADVASELENAGFEIVRTARNKRYPKYHVFIFEETPAFHRSMTEIVNEMKKRKR